MNQSLPRSGVAPAVFECAYNLFRYGPCDLLCAVPESRPVPGFIKNPVWHFAGNLKQTETAPAGFDADAARTGIRFNGFHLFLETAQIRPAPKEVVVVGVAVPAWEGTGTSGEAAPAKCLNDNSLTAGNTAVGS
jgi:hypothetical protein